MDESAFKKIEYNREPQVVKNHIEMNMWKLRLLDSLAICKHSPAFSLALLF